MSVPDPSPEAARRLRRNWIAFIAMTFGVFMAFLDIQIVASSLNEIQAGLAATPQEIAWVQSAYLIAEVIAIPLSGYLSRILSTRIYFTLSVLGFTAASLACALAWNIESMMVFRAIQGFLGGGMIPSSFAALFLIFPPEKRVLPQVIAGLVATSAPTLGPIFGGYITDLWSWHWLFLINLAPGLIVAAVVWNLLDIDRPDHSLWRSIDIPGTVYMALFLGALVWVLEEGPVHGWLDDGVIRFWAAMSALGALLFFMRVLTHDNPIVSLRPFRNPHFAVANLAAMLLSISLFATNFILPLFLGQIRGFNSVQIGNTLMVSGMAMFVAAIFAARLVRKYDVRVLFTFGCILVAVGSVWMARLTPDTGYDELFWPQCLRSFGFMLSLVCCSTLSLSTLPLQEVKNASAMYSLMRNLGGALGLASINTLMLWRGAVHSQHLEESLSLERAPVREWLGSLPGSMSQTPDTTLMVAQLAQRVARQSSVLAYNDALIVITWVGALAIPLFLFVSRPRFASAPAAH